MSELQLELAPRLGEVRTPNWPAGEVAGEDLARSRRRRVVAGAVHMITVAVAVIVTSVLAVMIGMR
jgi:hypothetical protein